MVINKSNIIKQMVSIIITMIFCFSLSSCRKNNSEVNSKQVAFDINRSDFDKLNQFFEEQYSSCTVSSGSNTFVYDLNGVK